MQLCRLLAALAQILPTLYDMVLCTASALASYALQMTIASLRLSDWFGRQEAENRAAWFTE